MSCTVRFIRSLSPLVWDLGHIAAYEDLWCAHRLGGEPLLRPDLAALYDAFETPRVARVGVELLGYDDALAYMRRRARADTRHPRGPRAERRPRARPAARAPAQRDDAPGALPRRSTRRCAGRDAVVSEEPSFVDVPAGSFAMGAPGEGFAYDNERPRHEVDVPAFRITRKPVTNATYLRFVEGGGYERREWWSDEGWAWKEQYDITHPTGWTGPDEKPVQHVSWFEADAFARSLGARLPTETEWEKAATWDHGTLLDGVGLVWEWTSTAFDGYPGFVAHPYREYSEVFFGRGYRVLRGGSCASSARVATRTFRNWDLPQRSQIFSGIRLVEGNGS